jgi:hypothetical protein
MISNNAIVTAISGGNPSACEKKCWVPGKINPDFRTNPEDYSKVEIAKIKL